MRRTVTRATVVTAAALAPAACDAGDESNEGSQDTAVDAPTEDVPTDGVEEAPSADGDVDVEGPDGPATDEGVAAPDGDANWSGPPSDQVGVPLGLQPTVVEGDGVVISLAGVSVYGDGMDLTLGIHWDPDGGAVSQEASRPMDAFGADERPESEEDLPDELLRVELVYPDGSTASSVDHLLATAAGSDPEEPALNPYTGMGDQTSWNQSLWTWPLPEEGEGSMELMIDWPAQAIDEEQIELDVFVDRLDEAAEQVVQLWD